MNDQILLSKDREILEQHGTTVLYVLFMIFVSGKAEAEGNGRFHQRPEYDRDRFLRRWSKAQVFAPGVGWMIIHDIRGRRWMIFGTRNVWKIEAILKP